MSVLDDYFVGPKVSTLAKSLARNGKDWAIPVHGSMSLRIEQASAPAIAARARASTRSKPASTAPARRSPSRIARLFGQSIEAIFEDR